MIFVLKFFNFIWYRSQHIKLALTPLIDPRTAIKKTIYQNSNPINPYIYHVPQIISNCAYNKWKEEIRQNFCQIRYVCSEIHSLLKSSIFLSTTCVNILPVFDDIAKMKPHTATAIVQHLNEKYPNGK